MEDRRDFLRKALGFLALCGAPPWTRAVLAGSRGLVSPGGVDPRSLVNRNPAEIEPQILRTLPLTPLEKFGNMGLSDHEVDVKSWRLEVKGHVREEIRLTYEDILGLPVIEKNVLLICPGFFVNNGRWAGFSVGEVLKKARAEPGATHVTVGGPEGEYALTQRYPMADILTNKVFLAYRVNGRTLPRKHGFPLRAVAEGYFGYDWVKYVALIRVDKVSEGRQG